MDKPNNKTEDLGTKKDFTGILNRLIKNRIIPPINQKIKTVISSAGYDPWEHPVQKKWQSRKSIGGIEYDLTIEIGLYDLKGLSSLEIASLKITNLDEAASDQLDSATNAYVGEGEIDVQIGVITTELKSILTAEAAGFNHSTTFSKTIQLKPMIGAGEFQLKIDLESFSSIILKEVMLTSLSFDTQEVTVQLEDLGLFEPLKQEINNHIQDVILHFINDKLSPILLELLNTSIKKVLPKTLKIG